MRTTLEKRLKADEVSREAVHHGFDTLRGKKRVEGLGYGWSPIPEATTGWDQGKVPTNIVWSRIRPHKVRSESSSCDLVVV